MPEYKWWIVCPNEQSVTIKYGVPGYRGEYKNSGGYCHFSCPDGHQYSMKVPDLFTPNPDECTVRVFKSDHGVLFADRDSAFNFYAQYCEFLANQKIDRQMARKKIIDLLI